MRFREHDRLPRWIEGLLLVAVALQVVTPLFAHFAGTDGPSQMYLLDRFAQSLSEGQLLPRWVHSGFGGRGSPAFYFYPPLAFYYGSVVKFALGLSSWNAIFEWSTWLATLASFATAYYLIRQLGRPKYWSAVGAALFAYAPFRIAELYSRSSISSHVAFVFVPLVCLGFVWIFQDRRAHGVLLLGIAAACLVLTSITVGAAVALMAAAALLANYSALNRDRLLDLLSAGAIAFGLCAYYLLPAVTLSNNLQTSQYWRDPAFFILDLLQWRAPVVLYHTALIFVSAAVGVAAWLLIRRSAASPLEKVTSRVAVVLAALVAFLQLPYIALPVWHMFPPLRLLQSSWRMYIGIVLCAAVVVVVVRSARFRPISNTFMALLSLAALLPAVVVILNVHLFTHAEPAPGDPFEYLPKNAAALPEIQSPIAANSILSAQPPLAREGIVLMRTGPTTRVYRVQLDSPATVSLPLLYWPLLTFQAGDTALTPFQDANGYVRLSLPRGRYELSMSLRRSAVEIVGAWISALTLAGVIIFAIALRLRKGQRSAAKLENTRGRTKEEMVLSEKS